MSNETPRVVTKVPAIPDIPLGEISTDALHGILSAIKQLLETREGIVAGGTKSRFLTIRDLEKTGVVLPNGLPK
jgi:hypothetical protein